MPRRTTSRVVDFSGGIIGGMSEYGRRVRHLKQADNVILRPHGALGVRKGTQRLSSATLNYVPHSAFEFVTSAGAGQMYVGCGSGPCRIYQATSSSFTRQYVPYALGTGKLSSAQLNNAVWVTELGGTATPMFYRETNPSNTFHRAILPRPAFPDISAGTSISGTGIPASTTVSASVSAGATQLTLSANATATGVVTLTIGTSYQSYVIPNCKTTSGTATVYYSPTSATAGDQMTLTDVATGNLDKDVDYYYRIRYRYSDGSSRASKAHLKHTGASNGGINITNIANEIRSDYVGWTLERTKNGGTSNGPFYWVADATTPTQTTYSDTAYDADLGYRSDENVHGEPPHMDGIIAYRDRLIGWAGSSVYFSQSIDDIEGTGIANWNALNSVDISPDDGDTISCVVLQVDRLLALKTHSVWGVEGDDITNFRTFPLFQGAGCSGPRAACSIGSSVFFFGEGGLHRVVGNSSAPFGWLEVGHIYDTINKVKLSDVVLKNYLGQYVLMSFATGEITNDRILVYDQRFGAWTMFTGLHWEDIVIQKSSEFGDSEAVVAIDARDFDSAGSHDYRVWIGMYGYKDERTAAGSGGTAPLVKIQTPRIDDGSPDVDKDWEGIILFMNGTSVSATVTIDVDGIASSTFSAYSAPTGTLWASATWGSFSWDKPADTNKNYGISAGTVGKRYTLKLSSQPDGEFTFNGYVMDGIVLPKSDYNKVI